MLHELGDKEKVKSLNDITDLSRQFISDINDDDGIKNLLLRIWAGCMSAANGIALETSSGPNSPERRNMIFSKKIDIISKTDPIYRARVEAAPAFRRIKNQSYSFKGVRETSPVKSIHDKQRYHTLFVKYCS